MFDTINGLPMHPLVVHSVVVLLPLTVIGAVLSAVSRRFRQRFGILFVVLGLLAVAATWVAEMSGEQFADRVGNPGEHAELGEQLILFALPLVVLLGLLVLLDRRPAQPDPTQGADSADQPFRTGRSSTLVRVLAVLTILAAIGAGYQVYRVGDTGSEAVWGDLPSAE